MVQQNADALDRAIARAELASGRVAQGHREAARDTRLVHGHGVIAETVTSAGPLLIRR